ncbi:unnamed protein product [Amoebophrya sp. A120]|nr:unnamed protein product [Amoebophrya sp. A120]|eukprot:GSA120T00003565001.1
MYYSLYTRVATSDSDFLPYLCLQSPVLSLRCLLDRLSGASSSVDAPDYSKKIQNCDFNTMLAEFSPVM